MAKIKKRAVAADIWLDRATDAQKEKMRAAFGLSPDGLQYRLDLSEKALREANAEVERLKAAAAPERIVPVHDLAKPEGKRDVSWPAANISAPTAYILESVRPTVDGGVPSYRLLMCKVDRGEITFVEAGVENMREVALRDIEDHILRDA